MYGKHMGVLQQICAQEPQSVDWRNSTEEMMDAFIKHHHCNNIYSCKQLIRKDLEGITAKTTLPVCLSARINHQADLMMNGGEASATCHFG